MEMNTEVKNINVLNALNIINPDLGDAYSKGDFNPFEGDFILKSEFVQRILQNNDCEVVMEPFLEQGNKTVRQNFLTSLENTDLMLEEIDLKQGQNIEYLKIFLKNRKQLLKNAIEKLLNENQDSFSLYKDIYCLDPQLSSKLKQSFHENFNHKIAVQEFLSVLQTLEPVKQAVKQQTKIVEKTPPKIPPKPKDLNQDIEK